MPLPQKCHGRHDTSLRHTPQALDVLSPRRRASVRTALWRHGACTKYLHVHPGQYTQRTWAELRTHAIHGDNSNSLGLTGPFPGKHVRRRKLRGGSVLFSVSREDTTAAALEEGGLGCVR